MATALQHYSELVPALMTGAALGVVTLEWIALGLSRKINRHREGVVNVASAVLTFIPIFALNQVLTIAAMFGLYHLSPLELGLAWPSWLLAYLAYDLSSYAVHRLSHRVRLLWCVHAVHHAPQEMKASVSFRGSFADFLVTPHTTLWLPLLGFHPLMIIIVEGAAMIWGVLLHLSEHALPPRDLPGLRRVLITPAVHRLHHASNPVYVDKNYGLTFALWDRLFGTHQLPATNEAPRYGLTKPIDSANLWVSQTDEFAALWRDVRATPRLAEKLGYLFKPPGWHP